MDPWPSMPQFKIKAHQNVKMLWIAKVDAQILDYWD